MNVLTTTKAPLKLTYPFVERRARVREKNNSELSKALLQESAIVWCDILNALRQVPVGYTVYVASPVESKVTTILREGFVKALQTRFASFSLTVCCGSWFIHRPEGMTFTAIEDFIAARTIAYESVHHDDI